MSGFGPRTYLVGRLLPVMIANHPGGAITSQSTAESLDEAIRLTLYIADLTLSRMGTQIVHDFEVTNCTRIAGHDGPCNGWQRKDCGRIPENVTPTAPQTSRDATPAEAAKDAKET